MIVIDLPWPNKALGPNARPHWAEKAKQTKKHREWAQWASRPHGPIEAEKLDVTVTFFPPAKYHYDGDNLIARCKAYFDGIADSLGVNDSRFSLQRVKLGNVIKHGNVRFELEVPE